MAGKYIKLNDRLSDYLLRHHSWADDRVLAKLREETNRLGSASVMQIAPEQGTLLSILVAMLGATTAVEIGTFTGYSSICIARSLPVHGKLYCFDINEQWTAIAKRYWREEGLSQRIELCLGDARQTLPDLALDREIDFAFIDGDKTEYAAYFEILLPKIRRGGVLVFDNMLSRGRVLSPSRLEDVTIAALNEQIVADDRIESVLLPIADGLMICRKR
jgi:caffeoyl-CoA O-methyltransferase